LPQLTDAPRRAEGWIESQNWAYETTLLLGKIKAAASLSIPGGLKKLTIRKFSHTPPEYLTVGLSLPWEGFQVGKKQYFGRIIPSNIEYRECRAQRATAISPALELM
jgi:hypothetical protein